MQEITINFIWTDRNLEWQIPEDWDPHLYNDSVSKNLNEVMDDWDFGQELESIFKTSIAPPSFLTKPEFDVTYLGSMFEEGSNSSKTLELFPTEWIELAKKLQSEDIDPPVIAVPHNMRPWDWYALEETEKMAQLGLGESDTLRADGVLFSAFNSFYCDVYRFGWVGYELRESIELEDLVKNPEFLSYAKEVMDRGPDSLFHQTCDQDCAFRPCSKIEIFPASVCLWG